MDWLINDLHYHKGSTCFVAFSVIRPDFRECTGLDGKKELIIDDYWLKNFNKRIITTGWKATPSGFSLHNSTINLVRLS